MLIKYSIDSTRSPRWFDLTFYEKKSGREFQTIKGIYRQVNEHSLLVNLNMAKDSAERPADLNMSDPNVIELTLNAPENYINILKLNEQDTIPGFIPFKKERLIKPGVKEIIYLQNNQPLNSNEFQTKEIEKYNKEGLLESKTYYNRAGKLFNNQFGYSKKVVSYNADHQLDVEKYTDKDGKLFIYQGGQVYPQVTYTYQDKRLTKKEMLINNEMYKKSRPAVIKYSYDSYGDDRSLDEYLIDGNKIPDKKIDENTRLLTDWIVTNAKYPDSFELLFYGGFSVSFEAGVNGKTKNSDTYDLYAEFYLNDSMNIRSKFTGFFRFNYEFKLIRIAFKTKSNGRSYNGEWNSDEYLRWMKLYGK